MAVIINLLGGPGAGKSTIAAEIFAILKFQGKSCELVPEFAKELVWDKSFSILDDQDWIFANQLRRFKRLVGQVDFIITDSPLLLTLAYGGDNLSKEFKAYVWSEYKKMENINVFIQRNFEYHTGGRVENREKAERLDKEILKILEEVPYWESLAEPAETAQEIVEVVLNGRNRTSTSST